jgi:hypothetical protein
MIEIKKIPTIGNIPNSIEIRMYDEESNNITIGFDGGNSETEAFKIATSRAMKTINNKYIFTFQNMGFALSKKEYDELVKALETL